MKVNSTITIVGAGLAGSEAAFQLAERGHKVRLIEMSPTRKTEAHRTSNFSELVCSNSFGSESPGAASSLLKDELESLGAFSLSVARAHRVPAGASLAMDQEEFSAEITETLSSHHNIRIIRQEKTEIDANSPTILATGPLTSAALSEGLEKMLGSTGLYFYDAISPIVSLESLDLSQMYFANRYDKGETADFLNVALTKPQYDELVQDLLAAEAVVPKDFEEEKYFEGCMPVEALAKRGENTLRFGPLKPVGLSQGRPEKPYAVIQLRAENKYKTSYNLVGFQTKMKYGEQTRVFRKLPGFANAEFLPLGSMHRNTHLDSPRQLLSTLQLKNNPTIFVAGQLTGTEGYLEATASGWLASFNCHLLLEGKPLAIPPLDTMLGALMRAITDASKKNFQPLNSNFGILPPIEEKIRDKMERRQRICDRALKSLNSWKEGYSGILESKRLAAFCRGEVNPCTPPPLPANPGTAF